jgi:hypothetical protein
LGINHGEVEDKRFESCLQRDPQGEFSKRLESRNGGNQRRFRQSEKGFGQQPVSYTLSGYEVSKEVLYEFIFW